MSAPDPSPASTTTTISDKAAILKSIDECRLRRVSGGNEDPLITTPTQPPRRHEHSVRVTDRAVKGELTEECGARRRRLAHHRERDGDRNRPIEPAAFLPQFRRSKVDRQPLPRKLQPAVAVRRSDALTRSFTDVAASPTNTNATSPCELSACTSTCS
jgi:hypothetical protein